MLSPLEMLLRDKGGHGVWFKKKTREMNVNFRDRYTRLEIKLPIGKAIGCANGS